MKELRIKQGIGQAELARQIGVTPAAVLYIEQPGNFPKAVMLPRIAKALRCKIEDLYDEEEKSHAGAS
ncbi:MAG: helix-turn-helix transcriptional regulator [Oscillospiraceae bacterium]|nr:helix-turn-helix transcriptional regulator [Oscillospiraceae bacterium]